MCLLGGILGGLLGAGLLACALSARYVQKPLTRMTGEWIMLNMVWSYSGVGIGAICAGFIGLHLQRCKLRPLLRKAIEEYEHAPKAPNKTTHLSVSLSVPRKTDRIWQDIQRQYPSLVAKLQVDGKV
jgi:hypothetical protein